MIMEQENILSGMRLVMKRKQSDGLASLSGTARSANSMDVIFNSQWELNEEREYMLDCCSGVFPRKEF